MVRRVGFQDLLTDVERPEPKKRNYTQSHPPSNVLTDDACLKWVEDKDKKQKEIAKKLAVKAEKKKNTSVKPTKKAKVEEEKVKKDPKPRGNRVKVQKGKEGWVCVLCDNEYGEEEEVDLWVECNKCGGKIHASCTKATKECSCDQKLIVVSK